MRMTWRRGLWVALVAVAVVAAGCGGDDGGGDDGSGSAESGTLRVPDDYETIQEAVDAAEPGDLILIEPGTYEEAVNVTTDDLVIRGLDRNEVVLDGGFELENGIRVLEADGVVVENLTVQNYTNNGVFFTGVDGYRGSYVSAIRNGVYGVYAFGSVNGVFEHSYASGSADWRLLRRAVLPLPRASSTTSCPSGTAWACSDTNAGGNLVVVNSVFRENRLGMVAASATCEGCSPQREADVRRAIRWWTTATRRPRRVGFALLAEGDRHHRRRRDRQRQIERNRVSGNPTAGVGDRAPCPSTTPSPPSRRPRTGRWTAWPTPSWPATR